MRIELLKELKAEIIKSVGNMNGEDLDVEEIQFFEYTPDEDETPQVLFDKDGVTATMEWEYGTLFISGLTKEEQLELNNV